MPAIERHGNQGTTKLLRLGVEHPKAIDGEREV